MNTATIKKDKCPVCGSASFTDLGIKTGKPTFEVSAIINGKEVSYRFQAYKCNICSLVYKSSQPDYDTLNAYYTGLDTGYENTAVEFPTDRAVISLISDADNKKLKILDYGCGSGRLLARLPETMEKFGVEINPEAVEAARKRNINIVEEAVLDNQYQGAFDYIILTDVFEHLYQPLDLLGKLVNLLAPGGQLLIVTGNADAISLPAYSGGYWYLQLFSHLQMLSKAHVQWLAEKLGLSVHAQLVTSHYDTPAGMKRKHALAKFVFRSYHGTRKFLPFIWKLPKLNNVKNWPYPLFDTANNDHLVISLKKQ